MSTSARPRTLASGTPQTSITQSNTSQPTTTSTLDSNAFNTVRAIDDFYRWNDEIYRRLAKRVNISDSAFDIFYALAEQDGLTQKQLCEASFSTKQTVHSAVKKLEREGYLAFRGETAKSRRAYLTPLGQHIVDTIIQPIMKAECKAAATFTEEEQRAFQIGMQRYTVELKAAFETLPFS